MNKNFQDSNAGIAVHLEGDVYPLNTPPMTRPNYP